MFQSLQELLNKFKELINSKKQQDTLPDQISFLNTIKILESNFMALSYCGIKLP